MGGEFDATKKSGPLLKILLQRMLTPYLDIDENYIHPQNIRLADAYFTL